MKIYFAGSIRGGQPDRDHYQKIITLLQEHGEVLTEHVGDLERSLHREDKETIEQIYAEDMRWLAAADVLVAEVTTPSLGVGYEIARAETLDKPILCLFRPGAELGLSLMLRGNPHVTVRAYQTFEELASDVTEFLKQHKIAVASQS